MHGSKLPCRRSVPAATPSAVEEATAFLICWIPPSYMCVHFPSLLQARALTPQTAETDAIRFLVGTQSLKYDNQVTIFDKCIHVNY